MRQEFVAGCGTGPTGTALLSVPRLGRVWRGLEGTAGGAEVAVKVIRLGGREGARSSRPFNLSRSVRLSESRPHDRLLAPRRRRAGDRRRPAQAGRLARRAARRPATMVALPLPRRFNPATDRRHGLGDKTQRQVGGVPAAGPRWHSRGRTARTWSDAARAIDFSTARSMRWPPGWRRSSTATSSPTTS